MDFGFNPEATTPVNVVKLEQELSSHPDKDFVSYLCNGLRYGFDSMVRYDIFESRECKNNFSARSQPKIVSDLILKECEKGFVYGPFQNPPFERCRVSP